MILILLGLSLLLYLLFWELYPVKRIKAKALSLVPEKLPDLYVYSFEIHLHTQFSYDSLGKPEDVIRSAREEGIDFVITTDHENDHIRHFLEGPLIAGREVKVHDEEGRLAGDLLEVGNIRVVAHPFKDKYRWRLELPEDYFFELIDLKDALLERKYILLLALPWLILRGLFSVRLVLEGLKKFIKVEDYARRYLKMGIKNPVLGGLDHHVKVYIREVGIRFLLPNYRHSFYLMRNFLISKREVKNREDFLRALREDSLVIAFTEKPTLFWTEGGYLHILPPKACLLLKVSSHEAYKGDYFLLDECCKGLYMGYTYRWSLGNLYFGLKPLFLFLVR